MCWMPRVGTPRLRLRWLCTNAIGRSGSWLAPGRRTPMAVTGTPVNWLDKRGCRPGYIGWTSI